MHSRDIGCFTDYHGKVFLSQIFLLVYNVLSDKVLKTAFNVHNCLGSNLLESVYQKAFEVELSHLDIPFKAQQPFKVYHRNQLVGEFFSDIAVDNKIIVELKSVTAFSPAMETQLLNYLSISGIPDDSACFRI